MRRAGLSFVAFLALIVPAAANGGVATPVPIEPGAPQSVVLVGELADQVGHSTDLQFIGNGVWTIDFDVPGGGTSYRIEVTSAGGGAVELYGEGPRPGGVPRTITHAGIRRVWFFFDEKTRSVVDTRSDAVAFAEIDGGPDGAGPCSSDLTTGASVGCWPNLMTDADDDGIVTLRTDPLPAGEHSVRVLVADEAEPVGEPNSIAIEGGPTAVEVSYDTTRQRVSLETLGSGPGLDGRVDLLGLGHQSHDPAYRQPFGAVPAGTKVLLRLRALHGDVDAVRARLYDTTAGRESFVDLAIAADDVPCDEPALAAARCDFWEATVAPPSPTTLYYRFIASDGAERAFYADDAALDGGWGRAGRQEVDHSYAITVYEPDFAPIDWLANGVAYQIFPDRFANGDPSNDPTGDDSRYEWPPSEEDRELLKPWGTKPEAPRGRDYYGGDLAGIRERLPYLTSLGVTVLYLNPIFAAGSNHAYDTRDYTRVDPRFGTQADWDALVAAAHEAGVHILLDGVFNHVSSDLPLFDRYAHFPEVGACEAITSPYRSWFTFHADAGGPCAGPDGPGTMDYDGWFGFSSLPVLVKTDPAVRSLVYEGDESVAARWLRDGASGWRLDVMQDPSFGPEWWPAFRDAVRAASPDAPIVGELWKRHEVLPFIHGDTADSVMDYRFRNAVQGYLGTVDNEGFPDDGESGQPPSRFVAKVLSLREEYPDAVWFQRLALLDSHDTERALWSFAAADGDDRESADALVAAKARLRLAAVLQFTLPGVPTIYYGDEVGVTGADDPDDRRTFPLFDDDGEPNAATADLDLLAWYRSLGALRAANEVLRTGDLRFLLADDSTGVLAYARTLPDDPDTIAIVALNRTDAAVEVSIPTEGWLRDGTTFQASGSLPEAAPVATAGGGLKVELGALEPVVLFALPNQDLAGPAAPTSLETLGSAGVELTWSAAADAASYEVGRAVVAGAEPGVIALATGPSSVDPDPGAAGDTRFYRVRAVDAAGDRGDWSDELRVIVRGAPEPTPTVSPEPPAGSPDGSPDALTLLLGAGAVLLLLAATLVLGMRRRAT